MKSAIVLSIPFSGTHFAVQLLRHLNIPVEFAHFQPSWEVRILDRLLFNFDRTKEFIVVPYRAAELIRATHMRRGNKPQSAKLNEYHSFYDTKDRVQSIIDSIGFVMLPIAKSPLRFDYVNLLRNTALDDSQTLSPEANKFILDWKPIKNDPNGIYQMSTHMLKESRDDTRN